MLSNLCFKTRRSDNGAIARRRRSGALVYNAKFHQNAIAYLGSSELDSWVGQVEEKLALSHELLAYLWHAHPGFSTESFQQIASR
jgi:hypothetical protein